MKRNYVIIWVLLSSAIFLSFNKGIDTISDKEAGDTTIIFKNPYFPSDIDVDTNFVKIKYGEHGFWGGKYSESIDIDGFKGRLKWSIGYVSFTDTISLMEFFIDSSAMIYNSKFYKPIDIFGGQLFGETSFETDTFRDYLSFQRISFHRSCFCEKNQFKTSVTFWNCNFNDTLSFKDSHFYNLLSLQNSKFKKNSSINFEHTKLPDTIDFSNVLTQGMIVDLTKADLNSPDRFTKPNGDYKRHLINLFKTDINKFKLDYIHFKLLLPDSTLVTDTTYAKVSVEDKEVVYEALLNNFKVNGQLESYKLLDIEYQEFKWENSWAKYFAWIPKLWWNFGYDKENIFLISIIFLLIFTSINFFLLNYLNQDVYYMENIPMDLKLETYRSKLKKNITILWYSFIYTSAIFFRLTLKIEKIKFSNVAGTIYLIFLYALGLICIAYMANFIIQK